MTEPWNGGGASADLEDEAEVIADEIVAVDAEAIVEHVDEADIEGDADDVTEVDAGDTGPQMQRPDPTGDARVDAAISRLDDLEGASVAEQAEIVDDVQRRLASALADLDPDSSPGS